MSRHPSSPPSKSENFRIASQSHNQHKFGEIAPQDSDTDSGICADSDQPSPRQPVEIPLLFTSNNYADYLVPDSYRRSLAKSDTARKLPQRPTASSSAVRNIKTYRVRFADELDSGASTSSTCSEQSTKSARCANTVQERQQTALDMQQTTSPYVNQLSRTTKPHSPPSSQNYSEQIEGSSSTLRKPNRSLNSYSYTIEDVESLPGPPSYDVAISRLRQFEKPRESIRDFVIRQNVNEALSRKLRNRSSSLPRIESADLDELAYRTAERPLSYQMDQLRNMAIGSLDNLNIEADSPNQNTMRRRRLPVAPLMGSLSRIPCSQPAETEFLGGTSRLMQRRPRERVAAMERFARRSASIGPQCEILEYGTRRDVPPVRAMLVALDQCGFRTVVVEKTQPGPFGFYIATGVMNGQRGIFISRVSIPSLSPMLSVGDEILYVDDQLVKGRSLETVQALIAGKTKVLIVLLPAIGSYIY